MDQSAAQYLTAFAQFYEVKEEIATTILGMEDNWRDMDSHEVEAFVQNLDRLFEVINNSRNESGSGEAL